MKVWWSVAGSFAAVCLAHSAQATLQFAIDVDGVNVARYTDNCVASATCPGGDQNPAVGTLSLSPNVFGGVSLNGSVQSSQGTVANPGSLRILNSSSLNITNTTGSTVHIQAAVGDTDFLSPVDQAFASASGTVQTGIGSTFAYTFANDALNRQGADDPLDLPGVPIDTFSFTSTLLADAFSHSAGPLSVSDLAPFSMTQAVDFFVVAGGQLVGNSQTELKTESVPEGVSTLGMLGIALTGFWFANRAYRYRDDALDHA